jgi:hypothetical protein
MSLRIVALFAVVLAACAPDPKPPVPVTRDALIGSWELERPNDEMYLLTLFDSGIVAFIHAGEKLPISRAFGRWSFDEGTLDLLIVRAEPDGTEFPLANRIIVMRDGTKLAFDVEGEPTRWAPKDRYGAAREGASERAANDERSWTMQVEAAEKAATDAPATDEP